MLNVGKQCNVFTNVEMLIDKLNQQENARNYLHVLPKQKLTISDVRRKYHTNKSFVGCNCFLVISYSVSHHVEQFFKNFYIFFPDLSLH